MLRTKCQAAEPSGSEEEDFIFLSVHFYGSSLAPPPPPLARCHFGSWDLRLNKLGKGLLGNATYQLSSI